MPGGNRLCAWTLAEILCVSPSFTDSGGPLFSLASWPLCSNLGHAHKIAPVNPPSLVLTGQRYQSPFATAPASRSKLQEPRSSIATADWPRKRDFLAAAL